VTLEESIRTAVEAAVHAEGDRILARVEELLAQRMPARGLSVDEFAAARGVSACTVRRGVVAGTIPHQRIGRRIVIPADAVQAAPDDVAVARLAAGARGR
jgi:excisionase family DNA binding protein